MKESKKLKEKIYYFFTTFFVSFLILLILSFLINSINYFNIFLRSLIFSLLLVFFLFVEEKMSGYFPTKLFIFSLILILITYIFSSYKNFKILDFILGIENFSEKIIKKELFFQNLISYPLVYKRYKDVEEIFEEKLKEFNSSIEYLELKIHENVNKIRSKFNISILTIDNKLREIARYHSKDMAEKNYFDHIGPNGESLADRFKLFNYTCKIIVDNYVYEGAENLFLGSIYKSYTYEKISGKIVSYDFYSLEELTQEVVNSWYNSEGHKKNMLFEHWKKEGIGIFIDKEGKVYVTQVFC